MSLNLSVCCLRVKFTNPRKLCYLGGETEAARFVEVRSETFGQVVSEPLRKGSFVKKNDILCVG